MGDLTESRARAQRHLLPRRPSDRVVLALIALGAAVAALLRMDLTYGLIPGAIAAVVQKGSGHLRAWRSQGVERAFVMESTALAFYVLFAALLGAAVAQALGVEVQIGWLLLATLMIETTVRHVRSSRYA